MVDRTTPGGSAGGEREHVYGAPHAATGERARSTGDALKRDVQETTQHAIEDARGRAAEEAREGKQALSHKVGAVAHALRRVGDSLDADGESGLARYGRSTADQVERFAGYLDRRDVRGLIADVEGMAKRNPGTFVATTFAAGLLLGRFLRASPDDRRAVRDDDRAVERAWNDARDRDFDGVAGEPVTDLPERREGAWGTQATHSGREPDA